jgi:hypothetical protein
MTKKPYRPGKRQDRRWKEEKGTIADFSRLFGFMRATDPGEPATSGQVVYLQSLRRRHGLEVWNETKARLGIDTPGTEDLSKADATRLISALLGGEDKKP